MIPNPRHVRQPVEVLRWSPTTWRRIEALRDSIMRGVGTDEPFVSENMDEVAALLGISPISMQWRKPLRIDEVNRLAETPDVRARPGRP